MDADALAPKFVGLILIVCFASIAIPVTQVNGQEGKQKVAATNTEPSNQETNSMLLQPWDGPYGGVPPWKMVKPDEFQSAFVKAIELATQDIEKIANNQSPATFENTFVTMEKSGRTLDNLATMFFVHASNLNVGTIPDIERAVGLMLSKHGDSITQNENCSPESPPFTKATK